MYELTIGNLRGLFDQYFSGSTSIIVRAPGRVNLIGEHTDYNEGFVMPLAIDRAVWIAARPRADRQVALHSENFAEREQFSLDNITKAARDRMWTNYVRGVAHILQTTGHVLRGMDALIWGDVPRGAGLSSSAALEMASALAFSTISDLAIVQADLALIAQRAEIEFVGVNCGIMDQMICALGQAGHAMLIDCRSLEHRPVPLPDQVAVVIADTMKRRGLLDSRYNERRAQCEAGARLLGVRSLRDVPIEGFERRQGLLPPLIRQRCRHVISENSRVLRCAALLESGDISGAGRLLTESHASLRDDYEVSSRELDAMVAASLKQDGILGARLTGAGFGGCTVNLVSQNRAEDFRSRVAEEYYRQTGIEPSIYVCRAAEGAQVY